MNTTDAEALKQELQEAKERVALLERSLVDTQRLATVGLLASRMAHEFRNLLMIVRERANQALKHNDPELKEKALRAAVQHGGRATDIVGGLVGYARGGQIKSELVAADQLMDAAVNLIAWDLPKDNVQLVRQYESAARVRVVPGRMEQVLLNLILNARKAMKPRGGTLSLQVAPSETRGYIALRVQDTGCGIPPEDLDRVFEPFFSTEPISDSNRGKTGTGLGLPVARDLVRQAGGEIHLQSRPGAGSTFTVLLPAVEA